MGAGHGSGIDTPRGCLSAARAPVVPPFNADLELACERLLHRYLRALDTRDWSVLESVFAAEVSFIRNGQPPLRTVEAIGEFFSQLQALRAQSGETHNTQHHLTTISVRARDETHAQSVAYVLVMRQIQKRGSPTITPLGAELLLEYQDRFARQRDEWRICRHEAQPLFRSPQAVAPR
jgi:hypothetical protein